MLLSAAILAMSFPAGAACGKLWARKARLGNEHLHALIASILPPYAAFCGLNLLMKD